MNPTHLIAAREARVVYLAANTSTVNGYTVYPDAPPGVGWVVLGPRGTKHSKHDRVKSTYLLRPRLLRWPIRCRR